MKRLLYAIPILLLAISAAAQGPGPGQVDVTVRNLKILPQNPPQPVPFTSVQLVGNPGPATVYYWIVANYAAGNSSPAGPFVGNQGPNSFGASNGFQIAWAPATGATSYDVLRTSSPASPSGACNCAVATAQTGLSVQDQSNSLNAYTLNTLDPNTMTILAQNQGGTLFFDHPISLPASPGNFTSVKFSETTAPTCLAGFDFLWGDSVAHRILECDNGGASTQLVHSGVDINTSDQVIATHLTAALPVGQGGLGVSASSVSAHRYFGNNTAGAAAGSFVQPAAADLSDGNTGTGAVVHVSAPTVTGLIDNGTSTFQRILVAGTAPTCSVTNAGTGSSCSAFGTDSGGFLSITTGTGPLALGTATLTFSASFGLSSGNCVFSLRNSSGTWNARATVIVNAISTTSNVVNWDNNAVALTSGVLYSISFWCSAK